MNGKVRDRNEICDGEEDGDVCLKLEGMFRREVVDKGERNGEWMSKNRE